MKKASTVALMATGASALCGAAPDCVAPLVCKSMTVGIITANVCTVDVATLTDQVATVVNDVVDVSAGILAEIQSTGVLQTLTTVNIGASLTDASAGLSFAADANLDIGALVSEAKDAIANFKAGAQAHIDLLTVKSEEFIMDLEAQAKAICDSINLAGDLSVAGAGTLEIGAITGTGTINVNSMVDIKTTVANAVASIGATVLADIKAGGTLDISALADISIGDVDINANGKLVVAHTGAKFPSIDEIKACAGTIRVQFDGAIPTTGIILSYTGTAPAVPDCVIELVSGIDAGVVTIDAVGSVTASGRRLLNTGSATFTDGTLTFDTTGGSNGAAAAGPAFATAAMLIATAAAL